MRIASDLYGMTLTRRCGDFVFVIAILWIFTIHLCRADEEIVRVERGGSATLPCMYRGDGVITSVKWSKSDSVIVEYRGEQLKPQNIAPHYSIVTNGKDKNDFSIILSSVEIHHEGNFTCSINVRGKAENIVKTINLEVTAKPQVEFNMNNGLKANGHRVTVARCTARNGRPPAIITWISQLEGKAIETRNESNGLVTIVSDYQVNLTDGSEGEKVSCRVEHSSLEKNPWIKEEIIVLDAKPEVEFNMNNRLKANGQWVTVARCTARNGRPPAIITWISQLEGNANETRNESNGLVTIISDYQVNLTDESEGENVSCRVEHSSFEINPWIKEGRIVLDAKPEVEFNMNNGLKANGQWVTVASCTARNGRPPAIITWSSQLEGKANETTNESNGLVTIVSDYQVNLTDESEGEKVSCRVEHSSMEINPWIKEGRIVLADTSVVEKIIKYLGIALGLLVLLLLLTALILFKKRNLSCPCNWRKCSGNEDCNELSVTYATVHVKGRGSEEASTVVSSKLESNSEYAEICSKKPRLA